MNLFYVIFMKFGFICDDIELFIFFFDLELVYVGINKFRKKYFNY